MSEQNVMQADSRPILDRIDAAVNTFTLPPAVNVLLMDAAQLLDAYQKRDKEAEAQVVAQTTPDGFKLWQAWGENAIYTGPNGELRFCRAVLQKEADGDAVAGAT